MRAAWSSSGGKDSLLALWYARSQGVNVQTMITMFHESGARSRSHGVSLDLMQRQARALGVELITPIASWRDYETVFVNTLLSLTETHNAVVFGDIDLLAHREWEEKVCAPAKLTALLPLWQRNRRELAEQSLALGFKSIVVCVDHRYLSRDYCGRAYDESFLKDLPPNVDACGENGEFHTFVFDGPMFSSALDVRVAQLEDYKAPEEFGSVHYTFARLE